MRLGERKAWFYDCKPATADMRTEVLAGLQASPKSLPPKYFYDARGSMLFNAITALPEYYPTRTEFGLLRRHGSDIADLLPDRSLLLEYGCGNIRKVRLILEALRPAAYVPLDISGEQLRHCALMLADHFPWLEVHATCVDYSQPFELDLPHLDRPRVAFFPGSSIGNFSPPQASAFLRRIRATIGDDGYLLIGIDLPKDRAVLQAAYDDVQGITAAFNRNMLHHINRVLGGNLEPNQFAHEACFDAEASCVEMYLRSQVAQVAQLSGTRICFRQDECIHTESSYKYDARRFSKLAGNAGFSLLQDWQDQRQWFALMLLRAS